MERAPDGSLRKSTARSGILEAELALASDELEEPEDSASELGEYSSPTNGQPALGVSTASSPEDNRALGCGGVSGAAESCSGEAAAGASGGLASSAVFVTANL